MKHFIIFIAILAVVTVAGATEANDLSIEFILQNPDGNCVTSIDLPGFENLEGLERIETTNWLLVYGENEPPKFVNKSALEGT